MPTVAEQGYPGFRTLTWNGYVAPAATPREIVERVAREIAAGCKDAAFIARLDKIGVDPVCSTPASSHRPSATTSRLWKEAVQAAGIEAAMNLRVAIPDLISPSYFPAIAAVELGFFRQEGFDATLELLLPVTKTYEDCATVELDFVGGASHAVLYAFKDWQGAKLLCALAQHMYWFLVVASKFDAGKVI